MSRHYPYKLHEVLTLTPRQCDAMVRSLGRERRDEWRQQAAVHGIKLDAEDEESGGEAESGKGYDSRAVDKVTGDDFQARLQRMKTAEKR